MIKKNNKDVGFILKGTHNIDTIYHGTDLVFEQGFTREDEGTTPLTTSHEAIGKDLKDYVIYGNSCQTSYTGKNLLNKNNSLLQGIREETGISAWASLAFDNSWVIGNLKSNTTYTISYDVECTAVPDFDTELSGDRGFGFILYSGETGYGVYSLGKAEEYLSAGEKRKISYTVTFNEGIELSEANYRIFVYTNRYLKNGSNVYATMVFSNIQIEEGSSATDYEPYVGGISSPNPDYPQEIQSVGDLVTDAADEHYGEYKIPVTVSDGINSSTTNIYLDEPLRKVGDYADYIDFKNQKVYRKTEKYVFNGTENFIDRSSTLTTRKFSVSSVLKIYAGVKCLSNIGSFENGTNAYATGELGVGLYSGNVNNSSIVYIEMPQEYSNVYLLKQYLSNNETYVIYPLAVPTEESIALPFIPTFNGTTVLEVNTETAPGKIEVIYKGK